MRWALGYLAIVGLTLNSWAQQQPPQSSVAGPLVRELNDSFAKVFERIAPAVVVINVEGIEAPRRSGRGRVWDMFQDGEQQQQGVSQEGSGFIISKDGYIMTNNHVIAGAADGGIEVILADGRHLKAAIAGQDQKSDIALLKVEANNLPVAELGDSDQAKVGNFAFAIGAPQSLPYTFTVGVISAKGRTNLIAENRYYEEFIQTDASINPGNSGGPLCDIDGKVVGINTMINVNGGGNTGLAFAVPINIAKDVSEQLIAKGYVSRAWLGISIVGISESAIARDYFPDLDHGVVVEDIEPNTPAGLSQLRRKDVILKVDGVTVAEAHDLQKQILGKKVGQTVQLDVWRGGKVVQVAVQTGEQPDRLVRASNSGQLPRFEPRLTPGVNLPMGIAVQDSSTADKAGAEIVQIQPNSAAEAAGLKIGDVITEVDGAKIGSKAEFDTAIGQGDASAGVTMLYSRSGEKAVAIVKP